MDILIQLNDLLLKMTWLNNVIFSLVSRVLDEPWNGIVTFFVYDTMKIFMLLSILIFTVSYIQTYITPEKSREILKPFKGISGNILGALLGTITPFCSCSSIPLFIGFTSAQLPLGVTFSFLISSPLVDLASILLLASIFGWKIALIYVVVGLVLAVISGTLIESLRMEDQVESFVYQSKSSVEYETFQPTTHERIESARLATLDIVKKVWLYIIVGVFLGALIHNVVPESLIQSVLGANHWYSVPLATLIGIPIYADIFGMLPIAEALFAKGVGLGTVLSLMMAVTALSLPSILLLKRVIKPKLLALFVGIVGIGIMVIGFIFNTWVI